MVVCVAYAASKQIANGAERGSDGAQPASDQHAGTAAFCARRSPLASGELPHVLTQRTCEYIESHLDQKIGLEALAAMAGLSACILRQRHSTATRWEYRLLGYLPGAAAGSKPSKLPPDGLRCRKSRPRPDSLTRATWHGISGGERGCRPGWRAGKTARPNRSKNVLIPAASFKILFLLAGSIAS